MAKLRVFNGTAIPSGLSNYGQSLWKRVMVEYSIDDVGGRELLYQACRGADRAESCADAVKRNGLMIGSRPNPLVREEMNARAFVVRTLQKLGVTLEPVKSPGRPASPVGVSYRAFE
jgi:hypothetical protein